MARAEAQARRRVTELERDRAGAGARDAQLAEAQGALEKLREEIDDLRSENDFLNGEVARYHQKNKDLLEQIKNG